MSRTKETQGRRDPVGSNNAGELLELASAELRSVSGEDASLEAQVLLAHALGTDRRRLLTQLGDRVARDAAGAFEAFVNRRKAREPLAYIVGAREFYGLEITCSPAALIPRPESEMLVDLARETVERRAGTVSVCDVGTGTGAVAVAVAAHASRARVTATDTSPAALALARENADRHRVADRVEFVGADLVDRIARFDAIVANLPYVSESEWAALEPEIRDHEPREALVGGPAGTEIIERLLRVAPAHLRPGGVIAVEIGADQGSSVVAAARASFPLARIELMRDLAGLDRVVVIYTEGV